MSRTKTFDRQAVLQAAMRVFWQKGYDATSMQDLLDATRSEEHTSELQSH